MKQYSLFTLLILFITSFNLTGMAEVNWKPFTSPEGKFTILMPNPPTFQKTQHKSLLGMVDENSYRSKSGSTSLYVEYSDIPRSAFFLTGVETIFDETREEFLNKGGGIQLQFSNVIFQGTPGKLLIFKIPPQQNEGEKIGKAYFYLINQRLYVLVGIVPRNLPTTDIDRFLSSFKAL